MMGQRQHARFTCAVCADDILGELPHREPFGRNGAMVNVCDDCHAPPPAKIAELGPAYQIPDAIPGPSTLAAMADKIRRLARAPRVIAAHNESCNEKTAGWILVRVSRQDDEGRPRDQHEAGRTLAEKPWRADLRYLGTDARWFLFERPPSERGRATARGDSPRRGRLGALMPDKFGNRRWIVKLSSSTYLYATKPSTDPKSSRWRPIPTSDKGMAFSFVVHDNAKLFAEQCDGIVEEI